MYIFEAHYIDMVTLSESVKKIEFTDSFDTEKESYLYAMSKAYDMATGNEYLSALDFIAG